MATTKKFLDITGLGKFLDKLKTIFALKSHSHSSFKGATDDSAGTSGYVPAPDAGDNTKVLYGDGNWRSSEITGKVTALQHVDGDPCVLVTVELDNTETSVIPVGSIVTIRNTIETDEVPIAKYVLSATAGGFGDLNNVIINGDTFVNPEAFYFHFPRNSIVQFRITENTTSIKDGSITGNLAEVISVAPMALYRISKSGNLVPESSEADSKKFLQGDGKWTTPASDQVLYQSSGTDTVKDKIVALNDGLKNKIMMEQITVKGIGESYFYIADKAGYYLMNVYNYAREYNNADVVKISHNVSQNLYYIFVDQSQPTTSSMALRLFWLKEN